jgi:hypothetical protein
MTEWLLHNHTSPAVLRLRICTDGCRSRNEDIGRHSKVIQAIGPFASALVVALHGRQRGVQTKEVLSRVIAAAVIRTTSQEGLQLLLSAAEIGFDLRRELFVRHVAASIAHDVDGGRDVLVTEQIEQCGESLFLCQIATGPENLICERAEV